MAQAGQYNYARALSHGEEGAAVLALAAFVKAAATALHLLNGRHGAVLQMDAAVGFPSSGSR